MCCGFEAHFTKPSSLQISKDRRRWRPSGMSMQLRSFSNFMPLNFCTSVPYIASLKLIVKNVQCHHFSGIVVVIAAKNSTRARQWVSSMSRKRLLGSKNRSTLAYIFLVNICEALRGEHERDFQCQQIRTSGYQRIFVESCSLQREAWLKRTECGRNWVNQQKKWNKTERKGKGALKRWVRKSEYIWIVGYVSI